MSTFALFTAKRTAFAPDVPTIAESGVPGYEADLWFGMWGPAGMPREVVARLHGAFTKALQRLCPDVTAADLELAQREGYESVEHTKRYTTFGMATDQGKTSNINALAVVADALENLGLAHVDLLMRPGWGGGTDLQYKAIRASAPWWSV